MDRQKKLLIFGAGLGFRRAPDLVLYAKTVAPQQERRLQVVVGVPRYADGHAAAQERSQAGELPREGCAQGRRLPDQRRGEPRAAGAREHQRAGAAHRSSPPPPRVEGVSSTIDPGFRAVSVQITDVSGVAGLMQPNSRVDVIFTRPGTMAEATTSIILQNVKVLSTGRSVPTGPAPDPRAPSRRWSRCC